MAAETYAEALKHVLRYEGGKVNHPADPGGATNQGVIQRTYTGYRKRNGLQNRHVFKMEPHERDAIYRSQYWDAVKGDQLPPGVDFVVFDGAVNSGPMQAVKWLQRALGVKVDGRLGEATLEAAADHPDHDRLVADILARRMKFLTALRTWKHFGKGWTSRLSQVKATGQAMATGSVGPAPVYEKGMERKALAEDAKQVPGKGIADAVTGAGAASAAVIQATKDAIEPASSLIPSLAKVVTLLTVVAALIGAAGL